LLIYSKIRVIDGDTIEIILFPSGVSEICRIVGLDCDEMDTKRGRNQKEIAVRYFLRRCFSPYVLSVRGRRRETKASYNKRCGRGRLLTRVYVWNGFKYTNYAELMIKNGDIKKGSKWNL